MRKVEIYIKVPELLLNLSIKAKGFGSAYIQLSKSHFSNTLATKTTLFSCVGLAFAGATLGGYESGKETQDNLYSYGRRKEMIAGGMFFGGLIGGFSGLLWPVMPLAVPAYFSYKSIVLATRDEILDRKLAFYAEDRKKKCVW